MKAKKNIPGLAFGLLAVVLVGVVLTKALDPDKNSPLPEDMIFRWEAPTSGSPVDHYQVEIRRGGPQSSDITLTTSNTNRITIGISDFLIVHEVRARGVDAQGRTGPWSAWSREYDRGLPDADFPGK